MRIASLALLLAIAWTGALVIIAHSPGLHSTPGMWTGVFGLPGVVIANSMHISIRPAIDYYLRYSVMFLVNWIFYCTVILGCVSIKRTFSK